MDEFAEKSAIRDRVRAISKGSGLLRPGLAASLGEGLCQLWKVSPNAVDADTRRYIARRFVEMIASTPDDSGAGWVTRAGQLSFNISNLTKGHSLSYSARRQFLDKPWRSKNNLPAPDVGYRSKGSIIGDTEKVYKYMASAIWAEWKKAFPGKSFPRDLAQQPADDDLEQEAHLDTVSTADELTTELSSAQQGTEDVSHRLRPPHRDRRKILALAGTAAMIIIGVLALLIVRPWTLSQAPPPLTDPTEPLAVTITSLQSSLDGYSLAFPINIAGKAATFEPEYQNATGDTQPTFERALQAGAYSLGSEILHLQARTSFNDQLVITGVHPVNIKRGPVATGTVINDPGGAGGGPNIGFDLDQPTADARMDNNGTLGAPYFQAQQLAVTKVSSTAIELEFIGHGASYTFNVEIDYLDGQQAKKLIVPSNTDQRQPFIGQVTGTLCDKPPNLTPGALAHFNTLEYGSVLQPAGNADGSFTMEPMSSADFKAQSCG